jgi:glycosyltransferase involved in cell wall biosynthesis
MRPEWESGLRGRLYTVGRRLTPLAWRRALRRRVPTERLLGIQKPAAEIAWVPPAPPPPSKDADDVVFLPVIPWSYRRQRPQHLAEALARRGRRVFYGSVAGSGEPREPAGAGPGVTLLPIDGPRREDLPQKTLAGRNLQRALASLAAAREQYSLTRATLVVQSPFWAPLAANLQERFGWHVVYDCLDAHTEFSTNRAASLADAERSLAAGADLVAATSEPLRRRLAKSNASVRLLPNACDPADFAGVTPPAPRVEKLTVGYAGAVDEWFDAELLDRLAALAPEWRFEIVGGLEGEGPAPASRPNVVFHGERPYREMPAFRSRFDVEIIPFRLSALTHATDPVKLYEAAAAGRPVVATPMEALAPLARLGLVRFASTPEEFVREISAAASAAGSPEAAARLRSFAAENSWDVRAAVLDSWILNLPPRAARAAAPERA